MSNKSSISMFEFVFGSVFFCAGLFATITLLWSGFKSHEAILFLIAPIFFFAFCSVGFGMIYSNIKEIKANKDVERLGKQYYAKIVSYKDSSVSYNGVPILVLVVIYCDNMCNVHPIEIDTGQTSESLYPLGANCMIKVYNGRAILVKGSIDCPVTINTQTVFDDYIKAHNEEQQRIANGEWIQ